MKPLAVHGGAAATMFSVCAAGWVAFELALAIRVRGGVTRHPSLLPLALSLVAGVALADFVARRVDGLALPGPGWWPVAIGAAVLALGLALRAWAVHELGRFFKFTVVVQADHRVVDTGPYRVIRHPSYTGLLMAELGLGIMLGTWLSIPAALLPPLVAFGVRIHREERVLACGLGEPYRAYMARTHRLVPGVW
jgi:protein-S-isoprenylcysteine O-methyltransferase Ste14